jgi:hypothetical protein
LPTFFPLPITEGAWLTYKVYIRYENTKKKIQNTKRWNLNMNVLHFFTRENIFNHRGMGVQKGRNKPHKAHKNTYKEISYFQELNFAPEKEKT